MSLPNQVVRLARAARLIARRWIEPVLPLEQMLQGAARYPGYFADMRAYRALPQAERLSLADGYPCLFDRTATTAFDAHYFYQAIWAIERIARCGAAAHVDVGSDHKFVGVLTTHLPVAFVDIRPLLAEVAGLSNVSGSLLALPFADGSVPSLSCLHVVEHIGLGRYGDELNPLGTRHACAELARVLAPGGSLFLSLPVGEPRLSFNAHRIHAPRQPLAYCAGLELVEFSAVDDHGRLQIHADLDTLGRERYACGLYWLRRKDGTL